MLRFTRNRSLTGVLAAIGLVPALLSACDSTLTNTPAAQPRPTPISRLHTTGMHIPRRGFCDRVPHRAVADALGLRPRQRQAWRLTQVGDGQAADIGEGSDVVAEHLCQWNRGTATDAAGAQAWVYDVPVDARLASDALRSARSDTACRVVVGPRFGRPSVTQVCRHNDLTTVRHAGRFGQSWLSCQVSAFGDPATVTRRADRWCVSVVTAVSGQVSGQGSG